MEGYDFGCAVGDGIDGSKCEIACETFTCVEAYRHCLTLLQCFGVYVNETAPAEAGDYALAYATLKSYVAIPPSSGAQKVREAEGGSSIVLSEASWLDRMSSSGQLVRPQQASSQFGLLPLDIDLVDPLIALPGARDYALAYGDEEAGGE